MQLDDLNDKTSRIELSSALDRHQFFRWIVVPCDFPVAINSADWVSTSMHRQVDNEPGKNYLKSSESFKERAKRDRLRGNFVLSRKHQKNSFCVHPHKSWSCGESERVQRSPHDMTSCAAFYLFWFSETHKARSRPLNEQSHDEMAILPALKLSLPRRILFYFLRRQHVELSSTEKATLTSVGSLATRLSTKAGDRLMWWLSDEFKIRSLSWACQVNFNANLRLEVITKVLRWILLARRFLSSAHDIHPSRFIIQIFFMNKQRRGFGQLAQCPIVIRWSAHVPDDATHNKFDRWHLSHNTESERASARRADNATIRESFFRRKTVSRSLYPLRSSSIDVNNELDSGHWVCKFRLATKLAIEIEITSVKSEFVVSWVSFSGRNLKQEVTPGRGDCLEGTSGELLDRILKSRWSLRNQI